MSPARQKVQPSLQLGWWVDKGDTVVGYHVSAQKKLATPGQTASCASSAAEFFPPLHTRPAQNLRRLSIIHGVLLTLGIQNGIPSCVTVMRPY